MPTNVKPLGKLIETDNLQTQPDLINWQNELSNCRPTLGELLDTLKISPADQSWLLHAKQADRQFPLRVTESFINRIQTGDINDPLLKQILPDAQEMELEQGFSLDPLQEASSNPLSGLLHKYQSRALLTIANSCAVNCRYCFRRHFPYNENNPSKKQWLPVFEYLRARPLINEAIYSGGDPLIVNDQSLSWFNQKLDAIPSLKRLRIHSRLPVVLPSRVTPAFIDSMAKWTKQTVMVIHCNHPNEIDSSVSDAIQALRDAGMQVLNQSVLLKGVNDSSSILADLSEKLFDIVVMPYYLHQLDTVQGAAHFNVSDIRAKHIQQELLSKLAGFLVPKLVREVAGEPNKTPL